MALTGMLMGLCPQLGNILFWNWNLLWELTPIYHAPSLLQRKNMSNKNWGIGHIQVPTWQESRSSLSGHTLVSGQLYLRPPWENPVWTLAHTNSVFTHSASQGCPLTLIGQNDFRLETKMTSYHKILTYNATHHPFVRWFWRKAKEKLSNSI